MCRGRRGSRVWSVTQTMTRHLSSPAMFHVEHCRRRPDAPAGHPGPPHHAPPARRSIHQCTPNRHDPGPARRLAHSSPAQRQSMFSPTGTIRYSPISHVPRGTCDSYVSPRIRFRLPQPPITHPQATTFETSCRRHALRPRCSTWNICLTRRRSHVHGRLIPNHVATSSASTDGREHCVGDTRCDQDVPRGTRDTAGRHNGAGPGRPTK